MSSQVSELHPQVEKCLAEFGIVHTVFSCDPELADTTRFCEHYGFSTGASANAIIAASKAEPVKFACCIVLATCKLDVNKKVSALLETKKVSFASAEQTLELTGMQIGGVTPFGLPEIPIFIDAQVMEQPEVIMGGGNRATKVFLNPLELKKLPGAVIIDGLGILK